MSGGRRCTYPAATITSDIPHPERHDHVVLDRNCNYSAFNGYRRTWSRYSAILCLQTGMVWRSKANANATLPDITPEQRSTWVKFGAQA